MEFQGLLALRNHSFITKCQYSLFQTEDSAAGTPSIPPARTQHTALLPRTTTGLSARWKGPGWWDQLGGQWSMYGYVQDLSLSLPLEAIPFQGGKAATQQGLELR